MKTTDLLYEGKVTPKPSGPPTHIAMAPLMLRLKKGFRSILMFGALAFVLEVISHIFDLNWLHWTAVVVAGIGVIAGIVTVFSGKAAPCPYCNSLVGADHDVYIGKLDDNEPVQCPKCFEWLISNQGEVRAMTGMEFQEKKAKVHAPVFEEGKWPNECLACGAAATKDEQLSKTSLDAWALLGAKLSIRSASVGNVPYCDQHGEQVSLSFIDDQPRLNFQDFDAMRRYTTVNLGKKPLLLKN